jgi:hypothetical protein
MGLALAGALSGMGEGLGRGLFAMEQGFIQQGLMQEREKLEQARLEKTFAHTERMADIAESRAAGREQRQMTHAENLQAGQIASNERLNQERIGAGLTEKGMDVQSRKELQAGDLAQKDKELTQRGELATAELGQKKELATAELGQRKSEKEGELALGKSKLANEKQHYKDWKDVYSQYAQARMTKAEGGGSEKSSGHRDALNYLGQLRQQIAGLEKSRAAAAEDFNQARLDQIDSMLEDAYTEYQAVQGHVKSQIGIPGAPKTGGPGGIVDPRKVQKK